MNTYIFLISSMFIFIIQLMAILTVFYIILLIIGWPIKGLWGRIKQIIKRGGNYYP